MTDTVHTASPNVQILDAEFFMPQLNRYRRVWIYLPPGYHTSRKRYPVLYMHDGQNLFDNATSFSGEWEVDETLDKSVHACIAVGIDNGEVLRMNEYNPEDTEMNGKGEGTLYLEFIVKTLKPFIDKKFRTLRAKKRTMIAGSSMGGLISLYAGLMYPKVFGVMGIFSPSLWIVPDLESELVKYIKRGKHATQKYYLYGGGAEQSNLVSNIITLAELLRKKLKAKVQVEINPEGTHNEACWRKEFAVFFEWIFK